MSRPDLSTFTGTADRKEAPDRGAHIEEWERLLIAAIIIATFLLNYAIELKFYRLGVLDEWDVIFDTDPVSALSSIANGWGGGTPGFSHPNFSYFFSLPIRAFARIASGLMLGEEHFIRKQLALLVVPMASAVQAGLIYLILRRWSLGIVQASLLTMVAIVSFSQLIFGSVPDSFGVSSLVIATAIFLMAAGIGGTSTKGFACWVVLGVVGAGVTITNIVPISILHFFSTLSTAPTLVIAAFRTIVAAIVAVAATLAIAFLGTALYGHNQRAFYEDMSRSEALQTEPTKRFTAFPLTLANTLLAPTPNIVENRPAILKHHKYPYSFTFDGSPNRSSPEFLSSILVLAMVMLGAINLMQGSSRDRRFAMALLAILTYNWILHSFWGTELFLYSSHWLVPELLLLSGLFRMKRFDYKVKVGLALMSLVFIAANNSLKLCFIFDTLVANFAT